jgi:hypothetical protein
MSKIARATVVGQGIRQCPHDQSALSFIDHDPVFVVKGHGRELALMMALGAPQLSKMDTFLLLSKNW